MAEPSKRARETVGVLVKSRVMTFCEDGSSYDAAHIIDKHMTALSIDDAVAELENLFEDRATQFAIAERYNKTIDIIRRSGREVSDG